jgi:uncharacterized protein YcaQ
VDKPREAQDVYPVTLTLEDLRAHAIAHTLFTPTTLAVALERIGFVQADPIRAPARAQDLILRQRVKGYRAGDLERRYPALDIEEGFLYAYGFMPRSLWHLRHPPNLARLPALEKKLLEAVTRRGTVHPDELAAEFGAKTAVNAWGGYSKRTKLALEHLHRRGLLRIARRDQGIRVYAPSLRALEREPPEQVFRTLVLSVVHVLAPIPERSLRSVVAPWARTLRAAGAARAIIRALFDAGELVAADVEGLRYVWRPDASRERARRKSAESAPLVRLLAPFDPLVWDRRRFEHLWGWAYRFEAYTPLAKRVRGYYALPLLWRDQIIGWANLSVAGGALEADIGFVERRPSAREFQSELDTELERMCAFLSLR